MALGRQNDVKDRAALPTRLRPYSPAVGFGNRAAYRETHAQPPALGRHERIKDTGHYILRNARTGVPDRDLDLALAVPSRVNRDLSQGAWPDVCRLHTVENQIEHQLFELREVSFNRRDPRREVLPDVDFSPLGIRCQQCCRAFSSERFRSVTSMTVL